MFIIINFINGILEKKHKLSQAIYIRIKHKKNLAAHATRSFKFSEFCSFLFKFADIANFGLFYLTIVIIT